MTAFELLQTILGFSMLAVAIWFCLRSLLWLATFIDNEVIEIPTYRRITAPPVSLLPTFASVTNHGTCVIRVCSWRAA